MSPGYECVGDGSSIMLLSSLMLAVKRLTTQLIWSMMECWGAPICSSRELLLMGPQLLPLPPLQRLLGYFETLPM